MLQVLLDNLIFAHQTLLSPVITSKKRFDFMPAAAAMRVDSSQRNFKCCAI